MKNDTKYALVVNGEVVLTSDHVEDVARLKSEFDRGRRTGRTTRMLFQALGDPSEEICIIANNSIMLDCLIKMMINIFDSLGFEFQYDKLDKSIENFGKTYYFRTSDQLTRVYTHPKFRKMTKYKDEF